MREKDLLSHLKLLILVNWKEEGNWPLRHHLGRMVQTVDILHPVSFNKAVPGIISRISNYLSEFYVPLLSLFRKNRYDVIISWQMRIGISYGILKRIFHRHHYPIHIIQDFHIDLTKSRRFYGFQMALLRFAIPGIDYFFCTSTEEETIYSQMFNIPRNRIVFLPLVETPHSFEEPSHPRKDYIFAYGKSDRDFDTLIKAVAPLHLQTYILSKKYRPRVPLPENVHIIRTYISAKEMIDWIASSRVVVLPLVDYRISAGQISMLEVMALARPLIVTKNMATQEYAIQQETAVFYSSGNARDLAEKIQHLWDNPDIAERMGQQARQAAFQLYDKRMSVFSRILECCATDILKGEHP